MGNGNIKTIPLNNKDNIIENQNNKIEKKTGKSFINSLFAKLEIFETKEINITIKNPFLNISNNIKIINEEIIDHILFDYYPNYNINLITTLNGYKLINDDSLKNNNVQDKDEICVSEPLMFYFYFSDGNKFPVMLLNIKYFLMFFKDFV